MVAKFGQVSFMSDGFYRAFEDRFRGSRELIKSRLRSYEPFLEPLSELFLQTKAVDLGCGRGEWIEVLQEFGFIAQGVDLDAGMLEACVERGLDVSLSDAITFLKALPSESYSLISAFHLVEHISFELVRTLVTEAHRVLMPGGLLILETPNPENLVVGSNSFYLDPTHQRPLPPQLLGFIPEYVGFERTKILRLQESFDLYSDAAPSLMVVLGGVSPDYAVVAQKQASAEVTERFNDAFKRGFGFDLKSVADRYELAVESRLNQAEQLAQSAISKTVESEVYIQNLVEQLRMVYGSRSWRITAPLRRITQIIKRLLS